MGVSGQDVKEFFLGVNPADVKLPGQFGELEERQRGLAGILEREARGGVTPGEVAAIQAGRRAAEGVGQAAQSRAAGARGFGAVAARRQAGSEAAVGQQQALGQAGIQAAQARQAGVQAARQGLANLSAQELQRLQLEEQFRQGRAGGGILPSVLAIGGGIAGGVAGGPKGAEVGAQLGGTLGSGIAGATR